MEVGEWFKDTVRGGLWTVTDTSNPYEKVLAQYPDMNTQIVEYRLSKTRFVYVSSDELDAAKEEAMRKFVLPDRKDIAFDTEFREPAFITARAEYSQMPKAQHLAPQFAQILKQHQLDGVNLAIEALDSPIGGFLNADGTGAGKTAQQLALAYHYVSTTGKSVVIFTESDQIMQQAFFGDARRLLGLPTPDAAEGGEGADACDNSRAPRNYKGLYGLYDAPQPRQGQATTIGLKKIPVVAFNPKKWSIDDGTITIAFYHHLSLWGQNHPTEQRLEDAYAQRTATDKRYTDLRSQISQNVKSKAYSAAQGKEMREQLRSDQDNEPIYALVIRLELEWEQVQAEGMKPFVEDAELVILDECFPYDTMIQTNQGLIKIGEIVEKRLPISVLSYNFETQRNEWKPITRWMRNNLRERNLIRVHHSNGSFVCTENHKIWTELYGYIEAGRLNSGTELRILPADISVSETWQNDNTVLWSSLLTPLYSTTKTSKARRYELA